MKSCFLAKSLCLLAVLVSLSAAMTVDAGENASNPLAKVKNTDLRWQYLDSDRGRINDFFVDGAFMASDNLKIKYELHYWETDVTGTSENDWESMTLKGIYFPKEGVLNDIQYRLAIGLDWIVDFGDLDKGIGSGSDQLGPFAGIAFGIGKGTTIIPLVQHFFDYDGEDVNTTAFRLIALQPLPEATWLKLDAKLPVDWENDTQVSSTVELQFGKNIHDAFALYIDGLIGIGGHRPYDWGTGVGLRFKY